MTFTYIKPRLTWPLILFCALLLIIRPVIAHAEQVEQAGSYTPHFHAYVDSSNTKSIRDIVELSDTDFTTVAPAGYVAGYDRSSHWLKFTLYPIANYHGTLWMRISPTYLDYIKLYIPTQDGSFLTYETGELSENREQKYDRTFTFQINNIYQPTTAYLRVDTINTHTVVADIYTESDYHITLLIDYTFSGIFIGILIALIIVNFNYIKLQNDRQFKLYYFVIITSLLVFITIHGFIALFTPFNWNSWLNYLPQITTLLYLIALTRFYHSIFEFDKISTPFHYWASICFQSFTILGFLSLSADFYIEFMPIYMPATAFYLLVITIYALNLTLQRRKEGGLLLLAVVFGFSGIIGTALSLSGITSGGVLLMYSYTAGSFGNIVFFQTIMNRRLCKAENDRIALLLQKEHAEALAQREKAEKEQKAQFLSMLSHELKTPLSVVKMGMGQTNISDTFRKHMNQAVSDMSMVIDRCGMLDRIEDNVITKMQNVEINALLNEVIHRNHSSARIVSHCPEETAEVWTDPDWLKIILANLLDNALKYSPKNSQITTSLVKRESTWCINIENITDDDLPDKNQIFNKYYRSKGAHKQTGSGIGLYIVKRLALQLGAIIEYIPIQSSDSFDKKVIFRLCLNTTH